MHSNSDFHGSVLMCKVLGTPDVFPLLSVEGCNIFIVTHTLTNMHTHHTHMLTFIHTCTQLYTLAHTYINVHMHPMYTLAHTCIYRDIHTNRYTYVQAYTHMP